MRIVLASALGTALLAPGPFAQTFNVDFQPSGAPQGRPPASYGAAAASPGYWNLVQTNSAAGLVAVDGSPTSVALTTNSFTPNGFSLHDFPTTSGADAMLLDDFHRPDDFQYSWEFTGLDPGDYAIHTVYVQNQNVLWTEITVPGSVEGMHMITGLWTGSFVHGESYVRHTKTVTDGRIVVQIALVGINDFAHVSGFQLVRNGELVVGLPMCFGDGSGAACPCGNSGVAAHGCDNSGSTGGALLSTSGTTSPDTIVLHASGERPNSLSIFLQGSASISATVFGDGLRCAGGTLKRLYTGTASGGAIARPGPGDPSITTRSAALGDPIPPGERRYYQTYYRDGSASFCPPPLGDSFNATNALRINW